MAEGRAWACVGGCGEKQPLARLFIPAAELSSQEHRRAPFGSLSRLDNVFRGTFQIDL